MLGQVLVSHSDIPQHSIKLQFPILLLTTAFGEASVSLALFRRESSSPLRRSSIKTRTQTPRDFGFNVPVLVSYNKIEKDSIQKCLARSSSDQFYLFRIPKSTEVTYVTSS